MDAPHADSTDSVKSSNPRWFPATPATESRHFDCGEVRYTRNGQRMIALGVGWSDNGYGPIPFGTGVAVAADCGWVWEPRVIKGCDLLSAAEYADYASTLAAHYTHHAADLRKRAEQDEARAASLALAAAAIRAAS